MTENPLFRLPQRRRHAAPRRLDRRGDRPRRLPERRAGRRRARPAASSRPPSTSPRSAPRTWRCSGRSCRWPRSSGASRWSSPRAARSSASRPPSSAASPTSTRACSALAVIVGALQGRTEEQVNLVNAPTMAQQRGIVFEEKAVSEAQDFNELIRVTVVAGGERVAVAGTGIGPQPGAAPRRGAGPAPDDRARAARDRLPLRGPARHDRPRRHDLRRARHQHLLRRGRSHARRRDADGERPKRLAAMVVTTDAPVPDEVVRGDRRLRGLRRRLVGRARLSRASGARTTPGSVGSADAGGGDHQARRARGAAGAGAARPGARPGRGADRVAAAGINFADVMARMGLYPDAPKTPCVVGYEVAGHDARAGRGRRGADARPARARGHPVRRLRLAGRRPGRRRGRAARRAELRAGRGDPRQLRRPPGPG